MFGSMCEEMLFLLYTSTLSNSWKDYINFFDSKDILACRYLKRKSRGKKEILVRGHFYDVKQLFGI